jgi:hypothetical protein
VSAAPLLVDVQGHATQPKEGEAALPGPGGAGIHDSLLSFLSYLLGFRLLKAKKLSNDTLYVRCCINIQ